MSHGVMFCVQVHGAHARSQVHPGKAASLIFCSRPVLPVQSGVWRQFACVSLRLLEREPFLGSSGPTSCPDTLSPGSLIVLHL